MSDDTREFLATLAFCAFLVLITALPSILTALK
jgi:hypothetical protein